MFEHILFPVDGSEGATALREHVAAIARWANATIDLLFVADTAQYSVTVVEAGTIDVLEARGEDVIDAARADLEAAGIDCQSAVVQGTPAREIVNYATDNGHDLVVMPTHGRTGLSRYLLGSVTESVVRTAPVPVLSARMDPDERLHFPYETLLVPTDGSDAADRAAEHAVALAAALDASIHVLTVVQEATLGADVRSTQSLGALESLAEDAAEEVVTLAEAHGVTDTEVHVRHGDPAAEITACVEANGTDAVVMGTTGRRGVDRLLLGSVAESTVRTSPVPVITVGPSP